MYANRAVPQINTGAECFCHPCAKIRKRMTVVHIYMKKERLISLNTGTVSQDRSDSQHECSHVNGSNCRYFTNSDEKACPMLSNQLIVHKIFIHVEIVIKVDKPAVLEGPKGDNRSIARSQANQRPDQFLCWVCPS